MEAQKNLTRDEDEYHSSLKILVESEASFPKKKEGFA